MKRLIEYLLNNPSVYPYRVGSKNKEAYTAKLKRELTKQGVEFKSFVLKDGEINILLPNNSLIITD